MAKTSDVTEFVQSVADKMGLALEAAAEEMPDGVRINLEGEDASMLTRRQGEALAALQHIVSAV
jgi:predicted RNA-binding protein Jag